MGGKSAYPEEFAASARAALNRFLVRENPTGGELTGKAAAKYLGTNQGTVSKIATGQQAITLPVAIALSRQLGVTLDDLFIREGRPLVAFKMPTAREVAIELRALDAEHRPGSRAK